MPGSPAPSDLRGVGVLVTGGTSGLGLAMARALVDAGARVVVTGRQPDRTAAVAAELGGGAVGVAMDVRDPAAVEDQVAAVVERLGGLHMVVANAGIGMRTVNPRFWVEPMPFWEVPVDGFRAVVDTKVTGTFLVARAVVPHMLRAGGGRVVVVSMNTQTMTRRGFVPYGPAGAGVEALARVMAADLQGSPVSVTILLPGGATATGMIPDDLPDEARAGLLDPAIMAPPIVWLASPAAVGVHGERIVATEFAQWLATR